MREEALLLTSDEPAGEICKAAKVLRFFGVLERALAVQEFWVFTGETQKSSVRYRLFCSSSTFIRLIAGLEESPAQVRRWHENVHSAFVYADDEGGYLETLARTLTGDAEATLKEMGGSAGDFVVSQELRDVCGVMTGVRLAAPRTEGEMRLALHTSSGNAAKIISIGAGGVFLKFRYQKIDVFLSTSRKIIDIDLELPTGAFDIREHVLAALPIVLYLKWAFPQSCWKVLETSACLIIDDPVLKPTYGFVDFRNLLDLMKRHSFSSNIAFIPWNWRRSDPEVARLFRENPREYSISIHGCDHTRREFGGVDRERLYWKGKHAVERMSHHEASTGIAHDRVMVFPQGVFSEAAMSALKQTELIGAVNNDTISVDPNPRAIRVSDVWDVAVMVYSDFPLFTRRYPWEGVENFAFDSLLGKPAISVIHHGFCRDRCARLVEFVEGLNALSCRPVWRGLAEVVRRSFRQRQLHSGVTEIEMYGAELRVENGSADTRRFCIKKRESNPELIDGVRTGSRQIPWDFGEGYLNVDLELKPGDSLLVRVEYRNLSDKRPITESRYYRLQTMLRRRLSEVRDNYGMKFGPLRLFGFLKAD